MGREGGARVHHEKTIHESEVKNKVWNGTGGIAKGGDVKREENLLKFLTVDLEPGGLALGST